MAEVSWSKSPLKRHVNKFTERSKKDLARCVKRDCAEALHPARSKQDQKKVARAPRDFKSVIG